MARSRPPRHPSAKERFSCSASKPPSAASPTELSSSCLIQSTPGRPKRPASRPRLMTDLSALFRLDGRVALVAGAASGIGRSAARGLAAAGATVVCADLNRAGAEETAREIRAGESAELDITDQASVARVVENIQRRHQ